MLDVRIIRRDLRGGKIFSEWGDNMVFGKTSACFSGEVDPKVDAIAF
jgi:hypothetical protein